MTTFRRRKQFAPCCFGDGECREIESGRRKADLECERLGGFPGYLNTPCSDLCCGKTLNYFELENETYTEKTNVINPPLRRKEYYSLVPSRKTILSGIMCDENGCNYITDLYDYIKRGGSTNTTFYPYLNNIYDRVEKGSITFDQPNKEHFVGMYVDGNKHGFEGRLTVEEMFAVHGGDSSTLTKNDIRAMIVSYEVEKSFNIQRNCVCDILSIRNFPTESYNLIFDYVTSPVESGCVNITVPKGIIKQVAKRIGATPTFFGVCNSENFISNTTVDSRSLSSKTHKKTPEDIIGMCHCPDGSNIKTGKGLCRSLHGEFKEIDFNFIDDIYTERKNTKSTSYKMDDYRRLSDVSNKTYPDKLNIPSSDTVDSSLINTCCPNLCIDCLLDAIREKESGTESNGGCDSRNECSGMGCGGNCETCGCTAPWTNKKKDKCWTCGPYGIKRDLFEKASKADEASCRVLKNLNWEKELCTACSGSDEDIRKCCERKHEISRLVIRCYWSYYTRNGNCKGGHGKCESINSQGKCFTCEDIVRQFTGGPCGHNHSSISKSAKYWNGIKNILCRISGRCKDCADSISNCGTNTHTPVFDSACSPRKINERTMFDNKICDTDDSGCGDSLSRSKLGTCCVRADCSHINKSNKTAKCWKCVGIPLKKCECAAYVGETSCREGSGEKWIWKPEEDNVGACDSCICNNPELRNYQIDEQCQKPKIADKLKRKFRERRINDYKVGGRGESPELDNYSNCKNRSIQNRIKCIKACKEGSEDQRECYTRCHCNNAIRMKECIRKHKDEFPSWNEFCKEAKSAVCSNLSQCRSVNAPEYLERPCYCKCQCNRPICRACEGTIYDIWAS
jgi:hypothetical protein